MVKCGAPTTRNIFVASHLLTHCNIIDGMGRVRCILHDTWTQELALASVQQQRIAAFLCWCGLRLR